MFKDTEDLCDALDEHWLVVVDMRKRLCSVLCEAVAEEKDEADGREYEVGLEAQKVAGYLIQVYNQALRDRRFVLDGYRGASSSMLEDCDDDEKKSWESIKLFDDIAKTGCTLIGKEFLNMLVKSMK